MSAPMSRTPSMYGYEHHHYSDNDDYHSESDEPPQRGRLPPLPQPPSQFRSVSKTRQRSNSSSGGSRLSRFFHFDDRRHQHEHEEEEHGHHPLSSDEEEDDAASSIGMFSRRARSVARQARQQGEGGGREGRGRSLSQPEPPSPSLVYPPSYPPSTAYDEAYSAGAYAASYSTNNDYGDHDDPSSPLTPLSPNDDDDGENPLFAPSLSLRQSARLSRASTHLQAKEAHRVAQEEKHKQRREMKGMFKVAVGVMEMVGEEKRERAREGRGRSSSRGRGRGKHAKHEEQHERTSVGAPPTTSSSSSFKRPSSAAASSASAALPSFIENLEHAASSLLPSPPPVSSSATTGAARTRSSTMDLIPPHLLPLVEAEIAARVSAITGVHPSVASSPAVVAAAAKPARKVEQGQGWKKALEGLEVAGGAAAVVGVVGAGVGEWWKHHHQQGAEDAEEKGEAEGNGATSATPHPAIRPASAAALVARPSPAALTPRPSSAVSHSSAISLPPPLLLKSLHTPLPLANTGTQKIYLSSLTPPEHHLLRHAAAALLLKDKARGVLHEEIERVVHGIAHLVELLEIGVERAWHKVHPPKKLFGTPLPLLTHHEGTLSTHGAGGAAHPVRVPEFVDHCVTALKLMDVTTEGLFRKSGNLRVVNEIINALDSSGSGGAGSSTAGGGGKETVIDLAALDPVTLADIFKKFLAALPDPLLTGHLFKLFTACSHIHHPTLRRRAMHLVVCLMPRVSRDVFEVVFLFLDWLSTFAHVDIKVGNQMDLSAIAVVMAPVLLRPNHRDPHPVEYKQMIAAVLQLLEDQKVLHEIPYDLAHVLHLQVPPEVHHKGGSAGLVAWLGKVL